MFPDDANAQARVERNVRLAHYVPAIHTALDEFSLISHAWNRGLTCTQIRFVFDSADIGSRLLDEPEL